MEKEKPLVRIGYFGLGSIIGILLLFFAGFVASMTTRFLPLALGSTFEKLVLTYDSIGLTVLILGTVLSAGLGFIIWRHYWQRLQPLVANPITFYGKAYLLFVISLGVLTVALDFLTVVATPFLMILGMDGGAKTSDATIEVLIVGNLAFTLIHALVIFIFLRYHWQMLQD